jgi:hypothetical protein
MKYSMILLIGMICFSSCFLSTWDARLLLINQSEHKIRYIWEIKSIIDSIPDTTYCKTDDLYDIEPHYEQVIRSQNKWQHSLKDPDKILRVFIINEDSLSKYGTCKVFKEQIFMKRFDLTYEDLEKLNWKVVYDEK